MDTILCVLNLTDPDMTIAPAFRTDSAVAIYSPDDIPRGGTLVLYVLGHAVPGGLVAGKVVLDDAVVAKTIRDRRTSDPTLIVWDVCFAEGMLRIPAGGWENNFIHIFSCQSFERTWHGGAQQNGPAISLFSTELKTAVGDLAARGDFTWPALESTLKARFLSIQEPSIVPQDSFQPTDFQLGSIFGPRSGMATLER